MSDDQVPPDQAVERGLRGYGDWLASSTGLEIQPAVAGEIIEQKSDGQNWPRSRRVLALAASLALLAAWSTWLVVSSGDTVDVDVAQPDPRGPLSDPTLATTTTFGNGIETGPVIAPSFEGLTLVAVRATADDLGLGVGVYETDPDIDAAVIIAQEPPAGTQLDAGDQIGLRTALPDIPVHLECDGKRHPRGPVSADELPSVSGVGRLFAAQAVSDLAALRSTPVFLGQWNRWAWQRDESGDVEVVPVRGFQVIVVSDDGNCGPVSPAFSGGVPVTEVEGPLEDLGERLTDVAPRVGSSIRPVVRRIDDPAPPVGAQEPVGRCYEVSLHEGNVEDVCLFSPGVLFWRHGATTLLLSLGDITLSQQARVPADPVAGLAAIDYRSVKDFAEPSLASCVDDDLIETVVDMLGPDGPAFQVRHCLRDHAVVGVEHLDEKERAQSQFLQRDAGGHWKLVAEVDFGIADRVERCSTVPDLSVRELCELLG